MRTVPPTTSSGASTCQASEPWSREPRAASAARRRGRWRPPAPARIVNLTSGGHLISDIHWDDPHFAQHPYEKWTAYGQSKTANVLFTVELEHRLGARGVHAFAVHPGMIMTDLGRHLTHDDF